MNNISEVVETTSTLVEDIVTNIHNFTASRLKQVAADPTCLEEVLVATEHFHQRESAPFWGLETSHKETAYFTKTGDLI